MQVIYRGETLNLVRLPDGRYQKPDVARFTTAGRGSTWLDDARIPTAERVQKAAGTPGFGEGREDGYEEGTGRVYGNDGRFPANLLVSDDVLTNGEHGHGAGKARAGKFGGDYDASSYDRGGPREMGRFGDSGGFSRFFSLDAWAEKTLPFLVCAKASKREKDAGVPNDSGRAFQERRLAQCATCGNKGLKPGAGKTLTCGHAEIEYVSVQSEVRGNNHPTVKPLQLMSYLITLGSRPGDIICDPFLGSGTTGVAAKMLGRNFIGIELSEEYVRIAQARVDSVNPPT